MYDVNKILGFIEGAKNIPGIPKDLINKIDKNIINQAINSTSKYSKDKNGVINAIQDLGQNGHNICNKINNIINNPIVRFGANKFGVKKDFLDEITEVLKGDNTTKTERIKSETKIINSNFQDRLRNLK